MNIDPSDLPKPKPRVAVIGCGYWGVNYVRVVREVADAELVAICEPRLERLRQVGARYPDTDLVPDLDTLLDREDVDAVVIATSATTHYDVARRCLEAGKHVLVEKPLATTSPDGQELVRMADEQGLTLMVGHTFVYNAAVAKLKEYVDEGALGEMYYLYARRTNLGPVRSDVNALWDLAPHDISIFGHLLGAAPEWVSATGVSVLRNGREDVGFITLGYPGGLIGNIHVSWADPDKVRELVVVGSKRRVAFDDVSGTEPVRLFEKGVAAPEEVDFPLKVRDGDIISPRIAPSEPLRNQVEHFIDCLTTGRVPATSGADGLVVVGVMEAVVKSMKRNGAPVPLDTRYLRMPAEPVASARTA